MQRIRRLAADVADVARRCDVPWCLPDWLAGRRLYCYTVHFKVSAPTVDRLFFLHATARRNISSTASHLWPLPSGHRLPGSKVMHCSSLRMNEEMQQHVARVTVNNVSMCDIKVIVTRNVSNKQRRWRQFENRKRLCHVTRPRDARCKARLANGRLTAINIYAVETRQLFVLVSKGHFVAEDVSTCWTHGLTWS